jgi:hypothetical protein
VSSENPNVFPSVGEVGYTSESSPDLVLRTFPDGNWRGYLRGPFQQRVITLHFTSASLATKNAIEGHFNGCMTGVTPFNFLFYNPDEYSGTIDTSGTNATGLYNAIYAVNTTDVRSQNTQATLLFTRVGKCSWAADIPILLLSSAAPTGV